MSILTIERFWLGFSFRKNTRICTFTLECCNKHSWRQDVNRVAKVKNQGDNQGRYKNQRDMNAANPGFCKAILTLNQQHIISMGVRKDTHS